MTILFFNVHVVSLSAKLVDVVSKSAKFNDVVADVATEV